MFCEFQRLVPQRILVLPSQRVPYIESDVLLKESGSNFHPLRLSWYHLNNGGWIPLHLGNFLVLI